jgi:hypothetical protein
MTTAPLCRFDGFDSSDFTKLDDYCRNALKSQLKPEKVDVQGRNAGTIELVSSTRPHEKKKSVRITILKRRHIGCPL